MRGYALNHFLAMRNNFLGSLLVAGQLLKGKKLSCSIVP